MADLLPPVADVAQERQVRWPQVPQRQHIASAQNSSHVKMGRSDPGNDQQSSSRFMPGFDAHTW